MDNLKNFRRTNYCGRPAPERRGQDRLPVRLGCSGSGTWAG